MWVLKKLSATGFTYYSELVNAKHRNVKNVCFSISVSRLLTFTPLRHTAVRQTETQGKRMYVSCSLIMGIYGFSLCPFSKSPHQEIKECSLSIPHVQIDKHYKNSILGQSLNAAYLRLQEGDLFLTLTVCPFWLAHSLCKGNQGRSCAFQRGVNSHCFDTDCLP